MLLTTHSLTGAILVTKIKNPLFSLPLVLISHYLSDFIPHWDLGYNIKQQSHLKIFLLALADGIATLISVFYLFQFRKKFSPLLWHGVGVSLLPDFLEVPMIFLDLNLFPKLNYFHSKVVHRNSPSIFWGLLPQVILVSLIIFLVLF
ncbi:MAG TPA: hypothetical protein VMW41_03560 [Candidatus Bathyarchaeia archaeon]|nr:hypothetical protein [Candidatus Bathyarchaeia archaeon]